MIEPTYFDDNSTAFAYLSYYTHLLGVVGCARYMVSAIFFGFERVRPLLFRASLLFTASEDIRVGVRSPLGAHISCQGTPQVPFDPHYGLRCPRLLTLCPPHVSGAPQGSTELSSPQRRPSARSDPPLLPVCMRPCGRPSGQRDENGGVLSLLHRFWVTQKGGRCASNNMHVYL